MPGRSSQHGDRTSHPAEPRAGRWEGKTYFKGIASLTLTFVAPDRLSIRIYQFGPSSKTSEYSELEKALTSMLAKALKEPDFRFVQSY